MIAAQGALPLEPRQQQAMAEASLENWETRILPTLTARQALVFTALHSYLTQTGAADVTGGELTDWMVARRLVRDVNGCRPRLTELAAKGWIVHRVLSRRCRQYGTVAQPYAPVVPLAAVQRKPL